MSFEGYYQIICNNGHESCAQLHEIDYEFDSLPMKDAHSRWECPYCKAKCAWWNLVDVTNGSFDDKNRRIDGFKELKIKAKAKTCTCKKCKNVHLIEQPTYHIPINKGHIV